MPNDWEHRMLIDIADVIISNVDKKTKEDETPVRLCNYTDVYYNQFIRRDMAFMSATAKEREIKKCSLFKGDVIITKDSETADDIGVPAYVRESIEGLVCGYHLVILRPKPNAVDGAFLFYALSDRAAQVQFHAKANGITRFGLRKNDIETVEVPIPPLPVQRQIGAILGSLEDKIDLNRRMNRTLEKMAAAIFKSWFIDFDPVHAKAEGRDPGLPAEIADLFPDSFEDSTLGPIPKGWTAGSLGDVADSPRRGVKPSDVPPTTPYIGLEHMPRRNIALDAWGRAEDVASGKSQFKQGEILFGKLRPYFHKVGIAPVDGVCSTDIVVVTPKASHWHGYVISLVSSKAFVDYTDSHSAGTKMPRTNWKDMGRYPLALPPMDLAKAFQEHVASFHQRIILTVRQNRRLAGLRDTLLPKLLSGEIELPEAEAIAEGVK